LNYKKYLDLKYIFTFSSINYLQSGISFIISILLARQLGKEDFGYFSYGLVFANTISTLMQFGTEKTIIRDLVQLNKPDLIIWSATWIWFVFGTIISAGTAIWSLFFSAMDYKAAIIVAASSFLGFARGMTPAAWFDFKGKANYQSFILLIDRLLFFATAVVIIFFLKNEQAVIYVSFAQLITRIIALAIEWKFVIKTSIHYLNPVYQTITQLIKNNVFVWLAGIGNLLMTQANQIILNEKFGPTELANYGLAIQIITIIRLLQMQLQRLTAPAIADITDKGNNPKSILNQLYKFCMLTFLLSIFLVIPAYFLTPFIIKTFIGQEYLSAVPTLNVLYAWSVLFGLAIIINQFLIGLHLQRFFFISTTIFGLMSLVLAELLTDKYKAMGAAVSLLIAHFCSVVFQLYVIIKKIKAKT
jgi:O-antigen/teichoic acid export membrane protein